MMTCSCFQKKEEKTTNDFKKDFESINEDMEADIHGESLQPQDPEIKLNDKMTLEELYSSPERQRDIKQTEDNLKRKVNWKHEDR